MAGPRVPASLFGSHIPITAPLSSDDKHAIVDIVQKRVDEVMGVANTESDTRLQSLAGISIAYLRQMQQIIEGKNICIAVKDAVILEKERDLERCRNRIREQRLTIQQSMRALDGGNMRAVAEIREVVGSGNDSLAEVVIFYVKVTLEVGSSILEPYAVFYALKYEHLSEKEKNSQIGTDLFGKKNMLLHSGVTVATVILILSLIELYISHKKQPLLEDGRFRLSRLLLIYLRKC